MQVDDINDSSIVADFDLRVWSGGLRMELSSKVAEIFCLFNQGTCRDDWDCPLESDSAGICLILSKACRLATRSLNFLLFQKEEQGLAANKFCDAASLGCDNL